MHNFTIPANNYLKKSIQAYYHQDYTTFGTEGNPDFLNYLKNQFNDTNVDTLNNAIGELVAVLEQDLPLIKNIYSHSTLTVCVIPRAKKESYYSEDQKLFRKVVSYVVDKLTGFHNGTSYIVRHTNTRTTHMDKSGYGGEGERPYVGITNDTCNISNEVNGQDILLIDDIYTRDVNIDEDAIQALLDKGARNIYFYAIGKTYKRQRFNISPVTNVDDDLPF